jgi:hypothetical protein
VDCPVFEVDLIPCQRHEFGHTQSVAEDDGNKECISESVASHLPGTVTKSKNLIDRQILSNTAGIVAATEGRKGATRRRQS